MLTGINKNQLYRKAFPNGIPKGDLNGKLDASWFSFFSYGFIQSDKPTDPASNAIAIWVDIGNNQIKIWDGKTWNTFA